MLKVHAIQNANRPGGDEIARDDAHGGARHGGVGQTLAESGLDFVAQLASGFLRRIQRHLIGNADAMRIFGGVAFGQQLFIHLRAKSMHQHNLHAHTLNHGQILCQMGQFARSNRLPTDRDDKRLVAKLVNIGRH